MPRRLAALHHEHQRTLHRRIDSGAEAVAGVVGNAWQAILAILRHPQGLGHDYRRALAILRALPGYLSNALATHFARSWQRGYQVAYAGIRSTARRLTEDVSDEPEPTPFLDLLVDPPDESILWRLIAPLVRPDAWLGIGGDTDRRLPADLANLLVQGLARGQTQREIALTLRPYFDGSRVRAARAARTFGLHVAHESQMETWAQLGDLVIGYEIHATLSPCPPSRKWHQARSGTIYYANPRLGQKGYFQMPRPPLEADDPAERPAGTPRTAFNCKCYNTPVLSI